MKLKVFYENLYNKIFSVKFFRMFLKIPGLEKLLQYETMSYLVFGFLTTVLNLVLFWGENKLVDALIKDPAVTYETLVLFRIGAFGFKWIYLANAIAWIFSVLFSFFTNKLFVFESPSFAAKVVWRELGTFVGSRIISFLLFEELLFGLLEALFSKMHLAGAIWIAKILVAVLVVVFNYVASKLVIFRKKKPAAGEEPDAAAAEAAGNEESGETE